MAHFPRPSPSLVRHCGPRAVIRLESTPFSGSTHWGVSRKEIHVSASEAKTVRTKKRYTELPKVWIRPDGTPATPLGKWAGGLETTSESIELDTEHQEPVIGEVSTLITESHDDVPLPKRATRRRRKATETALDADTAELQPPPDNDSPTPRKRTRKKKVVEEEPDASSALKDTANEVSEDVPTTTKRRRKKRETTEDSSPSQPKTPLAVEVLANLAKFPHCLLLTRVGQFYESYFDQAAEIAQLLNIKLTDKSWGGRRVLMCGFPLMHLDKHLKTLVQGHSRFVALCEEFLRFRTLGPKGGFDRRVTRIVTPGTLIDEPFLNQYENNYLLAIFQSTTPTSEPPSPIGLAWIDVSTGELFAKHVDRDSLQDELVRISPKEVVFDATFANVPTDPLRQIVTEEGLLTSFVTLTDEEKSSAHPPTSVAHSGSDDLSPQIEPHENPLHLTLTDAELDAVKLLTAYLHSNLLEHMPRLPSPSREAAAARMQIDAHTIKSLEIKESIREGGTAGSLFNVIKRTVTSGGARLLARWLCSPSTSLKEINARQSLVAFFFARADLRADLVQILGAVDDTSRIAQKFLLGRGDISDLQAICATLKLSSSVKARMELEKTMERQERGATVEDEWAAIDALMSRLDSLQDLIGRIQNAVMRTGAGETVDLPDGVDKEQADFGEDTFAPTGWSIRPDFSPELKSLHEKIADCLARKEELERRLQLKYDATSLSLRSSPGQGIHVHIGRTKRDSARIRSDPLFVPITESGTTSTFFYKEWSQLGAEIFETSSAIVNTEREAFESLRSDVNAHETEIRRNSRILDELDITLSFAVLAEELKLTRPVLKEDMTYHVVNGRHPTVELGLLTAGRSFTPNTISFAADGPLHIITGPNMAGKSTLLRQTALIAILAQTGSFVPADSAEIGVVDRVFSRVGAKDDLFRDRSTFMVEMLETADILRRATPQSLVIMDEVGRGTTVEDGLAIAFATVHHLLSVNRCRALFATHFHELADMLGYSDEHKGQVPFQGVSFFCTDINETEDGYFSYSHRLRPGVNRNSHGIKVAQLAGMPQSAVGIAETALSWLRARRSGNVEENRELLRTLGRSLVSP